MKLRYYADAPAEEWQNHALGLLGTCYDVHGIAVEVARVVERYGPIAGVSRRRPAHVGAGGIRTDLEHNRAPVDTIDQRPTDVYKRSGNLDVAGSVAVVDDEGTVRWASTFPGYADGYGPRALSRAMDFPEAIARSPSTRLCVECFDLLGGDERFCSNGGRAPVGSGRGHRPRSRSTYRSRSNASWASIISCISSSRTAPIASMACSLS